MKHLKLITKKGFTLIEVMVTVAIVGVIASIGFPIYENYLIRTQVSESLMLSSAAKLAVTEYYAQTGNFPYHGNVDYYPQYGSYVSEIKLNEVGAGAPGVIVSSFSSTTPFRANKKLDGLYIHLIPNAGSNKIILWSCTSNIPKDFLPTTITCSTP